MIAHHPATKVKESKEHLELTSSSRYQAPGNVFSNLPNPLHVSAIPARRTRYTGCFLLHDTHANELL